MSYFNRRRHLSRGENYYRKFFFHKIKKVTKISRKSKFSFIQSLMISGAFSPRSIHSQSFFFVCTINGWWLSRQKFCQTPCLPFNVWHHLGTAPQMIVGSCYVPSKVLCFWTDFGKRRVNRRLEMKVFFFENLVPSIQMHDH